MEIRKMIRENFMKFQIQVWADSLCPDIMADSARHIKARKDMLMAEDDESVNILSPPSLMVSVIGIAEDAADIKRYAII